MRKYKKMISTVLSLVLAVGLVGCGSGGNDAEITETTSVTVGAATPQVGSLTVSATYIGTVSPQDQVNVIPLVSGEVTEVNYEVGDFVEAGSVLVRIDDEAARLQLESAEISKKSAELSAQRTLGSAQDLSNISSMSSITGIQYQISAAQRQYESALDNVANSYQAKEDLKKSLDDINDSISKVKKEYKNLKNLAANAKELVVWYGEQWCWVTDVYQPTVTGGSGGETGNTGENGKISEDSQTNEDSRTDGSNDADTDVRNDESAEPEITGITGISLHNKTVNLPARLRESNNVHSLRFDTRSSYTMINIVNTNPTQEEWNALYAQVSALKALGYTAADIGGGKLDSAAAALKTQIDTLEAQADTLESNIDNMDTTIKSAERGAASAEDTIGMYEDNLKTAKEAYDIQNGQSYEDTKATLDNQIAAANVGVESAQMQLENYVLTAPISGYIEQKNIDEFGMVSAGTPLYVISNKDSMTITFYVSEAVRNQMALGQTVTLERNEQSFTATINEIGESVNARTGLFEIKASVEGSDLTNGVTVKVYADTAQTTNALLIPYDAVYFSNEQAYVYCVENDTLIKTRVETGIYNEDTIEITEGLTKDSVVVNTWSSQLMDGTKVHIEETEK